jgi:hypothetical protein
MNEETGIGIAAGCLDAPSGLHLGKHIFVASKGDYYSNPEDAPVFAEG